MSPSTRLTTIIAIVLACVGCDQATKVLAHERLAGAGPIAMLNDFFRLQYAENTGAFLGLGSSLPPAWQLGLFVFVVGGFTVAVLIYAARGRDVIPVEVIGLALVGAGGIGNLIDRLMLGAVRDFMNVGIGSLRTGIFNVADLALTTGAILFLLGPWIVRRRKPKEAA